MRTVRRLGARTVAVYSDADAARRLRARRRRGGLDRRRCCSRELSQGRPHHRGGARYRRRSDPSRLWLPFGKRRLRRSRRASRADLDRSAPRSHPRHGPQGRRQGADGKERRAGDARLSWRGPVGENAQGRGEEGRLSGADQGGGRRRRARHAPRRRRSRFRRCAHQRPARGQIQLWRRSRAGRKIHRQPAPHRGAGLRRQSRKHHSPVRTRLLPAAPPPEGDRGSARPRHDRGGAQGDDRRCHAAPPARSDTAMPARSNSSSMALAPCARTASGSWK